MKMWLGRRVDVATSLVQGEGGTLEKTGTSLFIIRLFNASTGS